MLIVHQLPTKGVQVPLHREPTMPSVQTHERDVVLFQSLGPWSSPWSNLAKPNLTDSDTLILRTVTSCTINTVCQFFSGTQARRAGTPPMSSQLHVVDFMRLYFKKPVITFLTSPISSLRTLATRTSPSCSTRTPSSQILRFTPSRKLRPAKIHGAWFYSLLETCCAALLFPVLQRSHLGPTLSNATSPLRCFF